MKFIKIFLLFFCIFIFAKNLNVLTPNSYYTNANVFKVYNEMLAYEEAKTLNKLLEDLLKNKKFKSYLYLNEIGEVNVSTITLLEQLKYFINGWPKYSDTYFENNTNLAGIEKILKDLIDNDLSFLNIPQNVISDMKKSILNLKFFYLAKTIENNLKQKNLKKSQNLIEIMKVFHLLIDNYFDTLSNVKYPLLDDFNKNIENMLERKYRIYAKTSLIKTIWVFKGLFDKNYYILKEN